MRLVGGVPLLLDIMNGNTKLSSRGHRAGWRGEGGGADEAEDSSSRCLASCPKSKASEAGKPLLSTQAGGGSAALERLTVQQQQQQQQQDTHLVSSQCVRLHSVSLCPQLNGNNQSCAGGGCHSWP